MSVFEILVLFFLVVLAGDRIGYLTSEHDYIFAALYIFYVIAAIIYTISVVL